MKKIVILSMVIGLGLSANAMDYSAPIGGLINDVGGMQNTDAQLKLLEPTMIKEKLLLVSSLTCIRQQKKLLTLRAKKRIQQYMILFCLELDQVKKIII